MKWKACPGFASYAVSDTGLVRRLVDGAVLAQRPSSNGYLRVSLWRDGRPHLRRVHLLVLHAFRGRPPSARHVGAHAPDRSRWNNTLVNLRWATPEANERDKKRHGTARNGGRHAPPTPPAEVFDIRRAHAAGESLTGIAARFGLHRHSVSRIVRGLRRATVAA